MEGNDLKTYENLCKIFEMRLKLDREKGIDTDKEVISNYEKYAKKIDTMFNSKFQVEIKPLIASSSGLEEERVRLTKVISLLEDRLRERENLEDKFYLATGKNLKGLQPIVSDEELKEKKDRLETIDKYLNTVSEIDDITDSLGKLENEINSLEQKRESYLVKNKIMEKELLDLFTDVIKEEEDYRDVSKDDITRLLMEVTDKVRETKETFDVTKASVDSLLGSGLNDDYSSYVEEAEKSYYVWKNREIILRVYDLVLDTYDDFKELYDKRKKIYDFLEERKVIRRDYHIDTMDELLKFESVLLEEIKVLEEEKDILENISNCSNRIKYKEDRLKELEDINNSVDVLAILREYGLIDTYDAKEDVVLEEIEEPEEDNVINRVLDPYCIKEIKDYPVTFNIGLAKLKGESVRDKVNKKLNPQVVVPEVDLKPEEIKIETPIANQEVVVGAEEVKENDSTTKEEASPINNEISPVSVMEPVVVPSLEENTSSVWEIPIDTKVEPVDEVSMKEDNFIENKMPEMIDNSNTMNSFWTTASSDKIGPEQFPNIEIPVYGNNNFASQNDNFGFPDIGSNN